jgi:hypothetical protein
MLPDVGVVVARIRREFDVLSRTLGTATESTSAVGSAPS